MITRCDFKNYELKNIIMSSRNNSIIFVDHQVELNSAWLRKINFRKQDFVILDPEKLFSEVDWTRYEDDIRVINKIYSWLFEEVVINNKTMICFWPLHQQYGSDWIELAALCKANTYKIEINKGLVFDKLNCDFDEITLASWKKLVYFLIESLFEDIQLNEEFDEIATLKSGNKTIILFKLEREGRSRYSYAIDSDFLELDSRNTENSAGKPSTFQSFETFNEMLEKLISENDLSHFDPQFGDKSLEKAYFRTLSKKIKPINLIESWLLTYSMN